jgi:hypothetical protein
MLSNEKDGLFGIRNTPFGAYVQMILKRTEKVAKFRWDIFNLVAIHIRFVLNYTVLEPFQQAQSGEQSRTTGKVKKMGIMRVAQFIISSLRTAGF